MEEKIKINSIIDGTKCNVIAGIHKGKSCIIRDLNTSKGGNVNISVIQKNEVRFKTLAKNVELINN